MFSFLFVFLLVFHFDVLERYNIFFSCLKSLSLLFWVSFFLSFFSVTTLFYLEDSRKAHLQGVRARRSKDTKRRAPHRAGESESSLAPLFICFFFFFLPPGPVLCKLGLGRSAVLPDVLTPVLGPFSVLFSRAFPILVF